MSYLKDIDTTVKSLDYGDDENNGRRRYTGRKHLGDGYVRVLYGLRHVDFWMYYVPYGYKVSQIRPSTNGISIRVNEWKDLMEIIIPAVCQCKTMHLCWRSFGSVRMATLFFLFFLWLLRLLLLGLDYWSSPSIGYRSFVMNEWIA